ncbi:MAG: hypothetical protein IJ599_01755 [Alphaproteobacteria bacterium]|nr:hypothetical protein [Alphaproteobacteria bacterium]
MKFWVKRKLKFYILAAFTALMGLSVTCEIFYSSYANKELILKFEKDYYSKKVSTMASKWLDSYFKQVELLINVLSKHTVLDHDTGELNFSDFEGLFKEGLKKTPFTKSFYVALKDGTYLQVRTTEEMTHFQAAAETPLPSYAKNAIRKFTFSKSGELEESWEYLNDDFTLITKEFLPSARYDPRERDWYVKAGLNRGVTWSDVYIFKTSKLPGLTISSPILGQSGDAVQGVVAVDFALKDFQGLLENVKTSEHSEAYLINDKSEIIASTKGLDDFMEQTNKEILLQKVSSCKDAILQNAAKKLLVADTHHASFDVDGEEFFGAIQRLQRVPFSIIAVSPQSDFTGELEHVQRSMFAISLGIFLLSCGVIFLLSRRISHPISQLCRSANSIGNMDEQYTTLPKSDISEIQELSTAMDTMKLSVSTFSKYAPKDLVRKLLRNGDMPELGGRMKEITLLFSDIEKFSTISEKLPAEYLILHLSEYFDELTKSIMQHNGTIDKYIGDAIMAIWGAPTSDENQVIDACEAALDCQKILEQLKEKWAPLGKPPLPTRIGLHSGSAIVGNIGSQDRMNFTAIGDCVNIASRLEGANKFYGTKILASETVESVARGRILFRTIDKIAVKGRQSGITVYEPICSMRDADESYYGVLELCSKSKEAFELYQSQNFQEALKLYGEIAETFPEKASATTLLVESCREFLKSPPKDWDGTRHMVSK